MLPLECVTPMTSASERGANNGRRRPRPATGLVQKRSNRYFRASSFIDTSPGLLLGLQETTVSS